MDKKLLVCINNYNKDKNAIKLYSLFSKHYETHILDTYHLDNGGKINCENVEYLHNVYCGGLFENDYKLFKNGDYKYLLIVESDVVISDENIINRINLVINDPTESIYAYAPSALSGSSCDGCNFPIIQNSYGFNNGTKRLRDAYKIEGWFSLYHREVVNSIFPLVHYENNKYGWFVHEACSRYAIKRGKRCVVDDAVSVFHTPGCGYSQNDAYREGINFKNEAFNKFNLYFIDEKYPDKGTRVLLCCIGKKENQYIREFVEYYKNLGFTNICLYDNNDEDGEHFQDVIGDYIDSGFVILKDYRGKKVCQFQAYDECYVEYHNDYDWIAYFDCDEFLELVNDKDINGYLSHFNNAEVIRINWVTYGDSERVSTSNGSVSGRFLFPCKIDKNISYDFIAENQITKSIVRCCRDRMKWVATPHGPFDTTLITVDSLNRPCDPIKIYTNSINIGLAYLKHYATKSTEEFCLKILRGYPDQIIDFNSDFINKKIKYYFSINEKTDEKIAMFKKYFGDKIVIE